MRQLADSVELVHRAIELSDSEDYAGAVNLLDRAIIAGPNNAQAFFERGMALLNLDKDADAVADFDRTLNIDPAFPGARDWRARAAESLGDHQCAAEDRLKELQAHPDGPYASMGVSPQKWADCAQAFMNGGNHGKAKELLEEYFSQYAAKVGSYARAETAPLRLLARLLIQTGDAVRARELAQSAYRSEHRCPTDVLVFALALEALGDVENARRICGEALKINDQMPGVKELSERLKG